jgi:DNA-binding response OmpR family regulator
MYKVLFSSESGTDFSKLILELSHKNIVCIKVVGEDDVLKQINANRPDLFVVEINSMPKDERLFRYIREEKKLPILAFTSPDVALNLDGTVDDFVLDSRDTQEVIIRATRLLSKRAKSTTPEQIIVGKLVIDIDKYEVHLDGRPISLTFREYELLKFLVANPGRVFSRDALLNGVWGEDFFGGDRTVDVHVRRLRSKIEDQTHTYIETVRNIGYRFVKKA